MEINLRRGDTDYGTWDVHDLSHLTFNGAAPNPGPRMIHAADVRLHGRRTTLGFLDGHVETRRLEAGDLPVKLFNPYAR
jgi:prepilin-type processing-associated H-X9-DG protein